jgi:hypothetical protein
MKLAINEVIEWLDDGSLVHVERVLYIDSSGTKMVTIDIDPENKKALPVWRKCEEVSLALAAGDARILDTDPYEQSGQALSKESRNHRDEIWDIIKPLIESESKEEIFIAEKRGPMIAKASESSKRAKRLIYMYLRRYWQSGQMKNALIPHYYKCGGKGKERQVKDRKRGRPRGVTQETQNPVMQTSMGVNITPEIRKVFHRGIRSFYENQDGRTLREAWQLTKEQFFHRGFELQNGVLVPLLPPAGELPTFEQFQYWYKKEQDLTRTITSRVGQRRFDISHRPLIGNPMERIFGPGSQYQIDATVGDIYLVSELDPSRIIGRPVNWSLDLSMEDDELLS